MQTRSFDFQFYTILLVLLPIGCFVLIILQLISDHIFNNVSTSANRRNQPLLYVIYSTGMFCGFAGFSLHVSTMKQWCEQYGFLPCFCFLGLSKASLYIFFLRRAESAHGIKLSRTKRIFFRYVAPLYLFLYWITYCILTSVVFEGKLVVGIEISNCIFARGAWWFSIFAACIDMINAMGSLALFILPLRSAMQQAALTKQNHTQYIEYLGFVSMMKWNILLTSIAAISSVITVLCFYIVQQWVWFFCLGDPFVNSLCTFLMLKTNRKLIQRICCCTCLRRGHRSDDATKNALQYTLEIDGIVVSSDTIHKPQQKEDIAEPAMMSKKKAISHGTDGQKQKYEIQIHKI